MAAWLTAGRSGNDGVAYYGTHTRVGELLVGAVLAYAVLSPGVPPAMATPAGIKASCATALLVALAGLAWLWSTTSLYSSNLFGGVTAVNAVLTACVVLAVTIPGPAATALGWQPLRAVGKISYAAYLVHWPIYLLLDEDRTGVDRTAAVPGLQGGHPGGGGGGDLGRRAPHPLSPGGSPGAGSAWRSASSLALVAAVALVLPEQPPRREPDRSTTATGPATSTS